MDYPGHYEPCNWQGTGMDAMMEVEVDHKGVRWVIHTNGQDVSVDSAEYIQPGLRPPSPAAMERMLNEYGAEVERQARAQFVEAHRKSNEGRS